LSAETYADRARMHAPKTVEETRKAAQRLLEAGYSDYDISAALGLAIEQVRRMLRDSDDSTGGQRGAGGDRGAPVTCVDFA
jgi:hypothetical protein